MNADFIPFADPHAAYLERKSEILRAVERVFDSGRYILGEEVSAFEAGFASFLGLKHSLAVANGTDALELALRGLGVGAGQAVFTVSHTAVATVSAIERAGATPVLADIDPQTYTMSPDSLEQAIERVKREHPELRPGAIIPVHIYGHPCDMDAILALAERYGLPVLEDCAQAHGACYKGRMAGTIGRIAAFSFYPTKNLGALGDAGGVATNDAGLARKIEALRQYGWAERYISAEAGVNSRMDPVQAAILQIQLRHLPEDNRNRRNLAEFYGRELAGLPGLALPQAAPWADHAYHLYVVRCAKREGLMKFLHDKGVGTALHYPQPVHLQPAYKGRVLTASGKGGSLPETEAVMPEILSLPMFPQLKEAAAGRVCAAIRDFCKK